MGEGGWIPEGGFVYLQGKWGGNAIKIKVMSEFEVLLDKVAKRLAKNYRPHRATLNKLYAYPIDPAFREYRLKARVMELRAEAAERQAEIEAMFARIMSNPAQYETVGEPMPHNIKFLG